MLHYFTQITLIDEPNLMWVLVLGFLNSSECACKARSKNHIHSQLKITKTILKQIDNVQHFNLLSSSPLSLQTHDMRVFIYTGVCALIHGTQNN